MVEEQRNQMSLHELAINALDRGRAFSLKEQSSSSAEALQSMSDGMSNQPTKPTESTLTRKYAGSKKAFFREFKKVVKAADVILEVPNATVEGKVLRALCRFWTRETHWAVGAQTLSK